MANSLWLKEPEIKYPIARHLNLYYQADPPLAEATGADWLMANMVYDPWAI
ncbi:MAG: hypothetical protein KAS99_00720 [Candidatus Omnitrophica bacterium]|nr:hypothetical protein [Candidatus Omnitrophota bacterium]